MDLKKLKELFLILDIEDKEQLNDFLNNVNYSKLLIIYENAKERTNIKQALDLVEAICDAAHLECNSELIDGLLLDEDLIDYVSNIDKSNNIIVKSLIESTKSITDEDDELDAGNVSAIDDIDDIPYYDDVDNISNFESEEDEEFNYDLYYDETDSEEDEELEEEEEENKENSKKKAPVYEVEEEKAVFTKYLELRTKLENYIMENKDRPEFGNFIYYVKNLKISRDDSKKINAQDKDQFIVRALWQLYRNTDQEDIVNIKRDDHIRELLNELEELREDITEHNTGLVTSIAKKYLNRGMNLNELESEGSIGLLKAINKFDVTKGYKFSTFATWWIRQAITRALENEGLLIKIPSHVYQSRRDITPALNYLKSNMHIEEADVTPKQVYETCKMLGIDISLSNAENALKIDEYRSITSTDKKVGEDEDTSLIDFIEDKKIESPEEYSIRREALEQLDVLLDKMYEEASKLKYKRDGTPSNLEPPYKQIEFETKKHKKIRIILTTKEYNYYIGNARKENEERSSKSISKLNTDKKSLSTNLREARKARRDRFFELLDKYKIDKNSLTSYYAETNIILTKEQRNILIYRIRVGLHNAMTKAFVNGRNYNNVLLGGPVSFEDPSTLHKVGLIFDVTRERVRQIESKKKRAIEFKLRRTYITKKISRNIFIGNTLNIFETFGISCKDTSSYFIKGPVSSIATVDNNGNITALKEGEIVFTLKNQRSLEIYELKLSVKDFNLIRARSLRVKKALKKDNR